MNAFEHFTDLLFAFFDGANLAVAYLFKLFFFKKRVCLVHCIEIENQYYLDKQVKKQSDRHGIKENIFDCIELEDGKEQADKKSAYCKKSYKIFASQLFPSKIQYFKYY